MTLRDYSTAPMLTCHLLYGANLRSLLPGRGASRLRVQTLLPHLKSLQEAMELATEREILCVGTLGTAADKAQNVRATGVTESNTAEPTLVGELTQLVQALMLREEQ